MYMNSLYFTLITFSYMYFGRKIGWILSRSILYNPKTSNLITIVICIVFGFFASMLIHLLIILEQPNIIIKIIFGYLLGAYVSIPNFGLVDTSTIPEDKLHHHSLIGNSSLISYIISLILFELLN